MLVYLFCFKKYISKQHFKKSSHFINITTLILVIVSHWILVSHLWLSFYWASTPGSYWVFWLLIHYPKNVCQYLRRVATHSLEWSHCMYVCFCGIWTIDGEGRQWSTCSRQHCPSLRGIILLVGGKLAGMMSLQNNLKLLRNHWNMALLYTDFSKVCSWKHFCCRVPCSKSLGNTAD